MQRSLKPNSIWEWILKLEINIALFLWNLIELPIPINATLENGLFELQLDCLKKTHFAQIVGLVVYISSGRIVSEKIWFASVEHNIYG